MTAPPTNPVEVSRGLSALTEQLRNHVLMFTEAETDAVRKRHAADMAEAHAFLNADGSVEARKQKAAVAADRQELDALVAEALVRSLKAKIRAIEVNIDVHRTFSTNMRAELKVLGMDGAA